MTPEEREAVQELLRDPFTTKAVLLDTLLDLGWLSPSGVAALREERDAALDEVGACDLAAVRAELEALRNDVAARERALDQVRATARAMLATFVHPTHPGRACRQSGHIDVRTLGSPSSPVCGSTSFSERPMPDDRPCGYHAQVHAGLRSALGRRHHGHRVARRAIAQIAGQCRECRNAGHEGT